VLIREAYKILNKNLALMTDFYELTMMQGFFARGVHNKLAVFDLYYRKNPFGNGYVIFAGLEQVINYVLNIKFSEQDIKFLRAQNIFQEEFLSYLKEFEFTGDIFSVREGSVVFPGEPLVTVRAPIIQAQLIESCMLNIINYESLIATKSARIKQVISQDIILEFGLRRAPSPEAALLGTRASFIGGCDATSNTLAGKIFDIPVAGTHAHSWIMSFDNELDAFREYAKYFRDNLILLVDTYNTLKSGVPNAIKVFKELNAQNKMPKKFGIRLDSGDFAYLTKQIRFMFNQENLHDAIIIVSNSLDENIIAALKQQDAQINSWGIGTKLLTGDGATALDGVYKLVALENKNKILEPKIKISDNPEKISTPCFKQTFRIYDKKNKKIKADLIGLHEEDFIINQDLNIYNPVISWKKIFLEKNYYFTRKMLEAVIINGERKISKINLNEIKKYCMLELKSLWPEYKRIINPEVMPVCLSKKLAIIKNNLLKINTANNY